jgi:ribosomal protein S18 acetylase RimI-like enzyme
MAVPISRPWRDEQDYERLRRFLRQLPGMAEEAGPLTIGDLDWWRYTHNNPDKMREVQLWLDADDGLVIGFVWPEEGTYDCFIDTGHAHLLAELVDWAEASARARDTKQIEVFANDRDEPRRALLKQAGYEPDDYHYVYRGQSITRELEAPVLPDGFSFRDMRDAGENEIERRVELHRAVWAPSKMTVAKHRAVMASAPTYRPDLDLIAVAPNGEFVSYTIVWLDPVNRIGVFEPVGCHPNYRQRGLTRAVMLEGLRRLKALGARKAFVNSLATSLPANRLYESSGFRLVDRQRKWVKSLE